MQSQRIDDDIYGLLEERLGTSLLAKRLETQVRHIGKVYVKDRGGVHIENSEEFMVFVRFVLKWTGMAGWGQRNALNIRVREHTVELTGLPIAFDGLRILQLSDIHLDGFTDECSSLFNTLDGLNFDACVITGDFRFYTFGPHQEVMPRVASLIERLQCPLGVTGILGNHDFIEFVPELEACGMRILLNEAIEWNRGGEKLIVAGVDDPHFYMTDDLDAALASLSPVSPSGNSDSVDSGSVHSESLTLLLAHSPELYREAEEHGVAYYLCGHTHGGQICLPGSIPLLTNCRTPRRYVAGAWAYRNLQGYTSRGTGASGVLARFFCPPEVTVHTLRRKG